MKQLAIASVLLLAYCAVVLGQPSQRPPHGISMPVEVVSVYDGDTIEVVPRVTFRVRLLDCWAPELRQAGGAESKAALEKMLATDQPITLHVPLERDGKTIDLQRALTFGRVLGYIFVGESLNVSAEMVKLKHATKDKPP